MRALRELILLLAALAAMGGLTWFLFMFVTAHKASLSEIEAAAHQARAMGGLKLAGGAVALFWLVARLWRR